jgi:starch synthase (maltosyl-transferring)
MPDQFAGPEASPRGELHSTTDLTNWHGTQRPVISRVLPSVDGGDFPAKATLGESIVIEADIFTDGPDELLAYALLRRTGADGWHSFPLVATGNDHWRGEAEVDELGSHDLAVRSTIDYFGSWRRDLGARVAAGQEIGVELLVGARLIRQAAERAKADDRLKLLTFASDLDDRAREVGDAAGSRGLAVAQEPSLGDLMLRYPDFGPATTSKVLRLQVERSKARFSSWYEMFPRSCSPDPSRTGTLGDVEARLPYVAGLGFDVLYLPPISPIGSTSRKGRNGSTSAEPGDLGSPWAIGDRSGGHTTINRDLGTIEDFDRLVVSANEVGIEIAIDLAFQCSPDHPWVKEHPTWFRQLPDGSIRTAENPPKRYEDIYPIDFSTPQWQQLWEALRRVTEFWIEHGVRIFRVDNPHTKPVRFWEWLIAEVRAEHPEVIFLAEAFTRPRMMEHLAKIGFSQSYTYFTWRNSAAEMKQYLTELTSRPLADYFRPNFWPNTPDILHEDLQTGGRAGFVARLVMAATLGSSYGIYGPAFEQLEGRPRHGGSEEYLNSEKYEARHWELDAPGNISNIVSSVNAARREHRALQQNRTLRFHHVDNENLLVYSKHSCEAGGARGRDIIIVAVSFDPHTTQSAMLHLDLGALGLSDSEPFVVHDLLSDARYTWTGADNFVKLDPLLTPAHIFHVEPWGYQ